MFDTSLHGGLSPHSYSGTWFMGALPSLICSFQGLHKGGRVISIKSITRGKKQRTHGGFFLEKLDLKVQHIIFMNIYSLARTQ